LFAFVDEIYTIIFLGEDLEKRVPWYYRAGWREMAEQDVTYRERYGADPSWKEWFEEHRQFLELTHKAWGISDTEASKPQLIRRWPTPGQMTRLNELSPESKKFFEFLEALFYREFSQGTHLTFPGLSLRGGSLLRKKDDDLRESEWLKIRSDSVGYAVVLLLALLTEINHLFGLALRQRCAYLWGVLREYMGIAKELYSERYESLLASR
jgi:hypothetical protein